MLDIAWVEDLIDDYHILCELQWTYDLSLAEVVHRHTPDSRFVVSALRYQRIVSLLDAWEAWDMGGHLATLHLRLALRQAEVPTRPVAG